MKSKPVKFGIRFYAVVGWKYACLHRISDNGSGNKTGVAPIDRYTSIIRTLRGAVDRKIDGKIIGKHTPSALWCAKMAHKTAQNPTYSSKRLMIMDNFYTGHVLACQLTVLSDVECKILCTVRMNNMDYVNRDAVR